MVEVRSARYGCTYYIMDVTPTIKYLTLGLTFGVGCFFIDLAAEIDDATMDDDLRHSRITEGNED